MINILPVLTISFSIAALLAAAYSLWQVRKAAQRGRIFEQQGKNLNLEEVLHYLNGQLKDAQRQQAETAAALAALEKKTEFAVQKIGLVRFNPFEDGGGNFSFCLALLDGHSNGVVVTSMHGRQQNRIYTKRIENGKCDIQLTDEEKQAVLLAHENPNKQPKSNH